MAREKGFGNYKQYQHYLEMEQKGKAAISPSTSAPDNDEEEFDIESPHLAKALSFLKEQNKTQSKKLEETIQTSQQTQKQPFKVPQIDPVEFIDNPVLERYYRLAELMEQTLETSMDDFTEVLAFTDSIEAEEFLDEFLSPNHYELDPVNNKIRLQPQLFSFLLERIEMLRKK